MPTTSTQNVQKLLTSPLLRYFLRGVWYSVSFESSAARQVLGGEDSLVGRALLDLMRAPTLHELVARVGDGHHEVAELD